MSLMTIGIDALELVAGYLSAADIANLVCTSAWFSRAMLGTLHLAATGGRTLAPPPYLLEDPVMVWDGEEECLPSDMRSLIAALLAGDPVAMCTAKNLAPNVSLDQCAQWCQPHRAPPAKSIMSLGDLVAQLFPSSGGVKRPNQLADELIPASHGRIIDFLASAPIEPESAYFTRWGTLPAVPNETVARVNAASVDVVGLFDDGSEIIQRLIGEISGQDRIDCDISHEVRFELGNALPGRHDPNQQGGDDYFIISSSMSTSVLATMDMAPGTMLDALAVTECRQQAPAAEEGEWWVDDFEWAGGEY